MKKCLSPTNYFDCSSIGANHFGIAGYYSMMAAKQGLIVSCMPFNSISWLNKTHSLPLYPYCPGFIGNGVY